MSTADARGGHEAAAFFARRGVVLDDEVLEIGHPHGAIGADLGMHGAVPFVAAGVKIEGIERFVAGAVGLHIHERDDFHRRFADHGHALEALGKSVAVDEVRACGGGVATEDIHLAKVRRDGVSGIDDIDFLCRHAAAAIGVGSGGDAAEEEGRAIGGATELIARVVGAVAPGVVGELMQELERAAVRLEAIGAHGELMLLAADVAFDAAVADAAVDPVVEAVVQVAGLRVGVADAPAVHDDLAFVGFVVAVGVLKVDELRWCGDDDALAGENDAGGQIEFVGEDGEFVRFAIAIGVLADFHAVLALTVFADAVRVVARLNDPATTAFIPGEGDGFGDVGFRCEELQLAIGWHLRALHAALGGERLLKGERLGALLVVRDLRMLFPLFRLSLGQKGLVGGFAFGGEFGEDGFAAQIITRFDHEVVVGVHFVLGVVKVDGVTTEVAHGMVQRGAISTWRVEIEHADGVGGSTETDEQKKQRFHGWVEVTHRNVLLQRECSDMFWARSVLFWS